MFHLIDGSNGYPKVSTDCLMRLAELTWPDTLALWDYHKVSMRPPLSNYLRPLVSGYLATRSINSLKATTFTYANPPLKHTNCSDRTCCPMTNCSVADQNCGYATMARSPCRLGSSHASERISPNQSLVSLCVRVEQLH